MGKIKDFIKKYKKGFMVTAAIIGGTTLTVLITKKIVTKNLWDMTDKSFISWTPVNSGHLTLDEVKKILELNANNSSQFAIFREGPASDAYNLILLGDKVAIPELPPIA